MSTSPLPHHRAGARVALVLILLAASRGGVHAGLETEFEKFIGRQAAQVVSETFGTEGDPLLLDWVRRVGARVSAAAPRHDVRYRFFIVEMSEPNAVALPGGYIFVTKGLLEFVNDDDELAAILAHEVGHVVGRHAMGHIKRQLLASLLIGAVQENAGDMMGTAA
ncbi:MAG: M48 family metalloprotease, partial [Armatimonadota bacterium]|nr:M48 family metalloprotease [Armatimonadota bacterium]